MGMTGTDDYLYQLRRSHYGEPFARQSYEGRVRIASAGGVVGPEPGTSFNPGLPVIDTLRNRTEVKPPSTGTAVLRSAQAPEPDRYALITGHEIADAMAQRPPRTDLKAVCQDIVLMFP